jgi:hypothetical protein
MPFIIGGGTGTTNLATGATRFVSMFNSALNASNTAVEVAVPVAGSITSLDVRLNDTAGAAPRSYMFAVSVNGVASTVACSISGAATSCASANSVAVVAGDRISIQVTPSSPAPTGRTMRWSAQFTP